MPIDGTPRYRIVELFAVSSQGILLQLNFTSTVHFIYILILLENKASAAKFPRSGGRMISAYSRSIPFRLAQNKFLANYEKLFAPYPKAKQFAFSSEQIKKLPFGVF